MKKQSMLFWVLMAAFVGMFLAGDVFAESQDTTVKEAKVAVHKAKKSAKTQKHKAKKKAKAAKRKAKKEAKAKANSEADAKAAEAQTLGGEAPSEVSAPAQGPVLTQELVPAETVQVPEPVQNS